MMKNDCQVEREMLVIDGTLNLMTGERKERSRSIQIRPCGTPLFGSRERRDGICTSCARGWETEGNRPTSKGREQIQACNLRFVLGTHVGFPKGD